MNTPPSVTIVGPTSVHAYALSNYSINFSDNDGDTPFSYAWSIVSGGGSITNTTSSTTTFISSGTGTTVIGCSVTDSRGAIGSDTHTIQRTNRAPSVSISGSRSVSRGGSARLTASGSDPDGSNDIRGYSWSVSSGSGSISSSSGTSTTYTASGSSGGTVRCVIRDRSGATGSDTHSISVVTNNPPTVVINGRSSMFLGDSATLNMVASDRDGR